VIIGRAAGICLDPESYGAKPWRWRSSAHADSKSYAEHWAKVRQRGREWIGVLQEEVPKVQVLLLFLSGTEFLTIDHSKIPSEVLAELEPATSGQAADYSLYPAFVEGMLLGASDGTTIIDGNEFSYYFPTGGDFGPYRQYHKDDAAGVYFSTEAQAKYRSHMQLANALYPDFPYGAYMPSWSGANSLSDAEQDAWAKYCVTQAFLTTDRYVWTYSDNFDWHTTGMPGNFAGMITGGRRDAAASATRIVTFDAIDAEHLWQPHSTAVPLDRDGRTGLRFAVPLDGDAYTPAMTTSPEGDG
jgi:hypothetical protein